MLTTLDNEMVVPSDKDAQVALMSNKALTSLLAHQESPYIHISTTGDHPTEIDLPVSIIRLLAEALKEMSEGRAVTLLPIHAELTTQQAAELMRVSRPSLIKLLDENKLPYRKIGVHRRIRYEDVFLYLKNERARRASVMKELIAETERLGLH